MKNIFTFLLLFVVFTGKLRLEQEKSQLGSHFNAEAQLLVNFINGKPETNNDW